STDDQDADHQTRRASAPSAVESPRCQFRERDASLDNQSVVSELDARREFCRVSLVHDVVGNMSKECATRLQLFDVLECFIDPKVCRVFAEAQTVEHQHVQTP